METLRHNLLIKKFRIQTWIGLRDEKKNDQFTNFVDGSPVCFTNWGGWALNHNGDCVEIVGSGNDISGGPHECVIFSEILHVFNFGMFLFPFVEGMGGMKTPVALKLVICAVQEARFFLPDGLLLCPI